jgi:hypothetical protein
MIFGLDSLPGRLLVLLSPSELDFIPVDSAENDHSRRTWYEKVGSAPMVIIAREFSISDRGLAMRCRYLRAAVDLT